MSSATAFSLPPHAGDSPGGHPARQAGILAGRLADLLDQVLSEVHEQAAARAFLRAMARAAAAEQDQASVDGPLQRLIAGFGLSPVECDLVLLAGLPEEHEGYSGVLRALHPRGEPRPSTGLAAQMFCASGAERRMLRGVLEVGVAVRAGIFRAGDEGPFWERSLFLGDGLWGALQGLYAWPAALVPAEGPVVAAGLRSWLEGPAATARAAIAAGRPWTVLITADGEEIAHQWAAALVVAAGATPARIAFPAGHTADVERLLSVHAVARGMVPVVRVPPAEGPGAPDAPMLLSHPGPVVLCARSGSLRLGGSRPVLEAPVLPLGADSRERMWRELLPELADRAPALAARYTVEPRAAAAAAEDALAQATLDGRLPNLDDVGRAVRTRAGLSVTGGVRLLRPTARWEQLVLREDRLAQLREALDRLVHQATVLDRWRFLEDRPGARGVRMLFAGPSGTGKTLAAEVMANTLGVDVLLVDISRVVSKWIGETEKNLAEVFEVAERAQAVLVFDEADALFGKRTEVSDAHDRYANLETAYLLTRLERFEGLAVLTTNLRQNIDPAFLRRLEFVVDFEEPGAVERAALWGCHFPSGAPLGRDLDVCELAEHYPVVGGIIRNAAVAAAFLAATEDSPITRSHVVRAIRREYDKSGRAFPGLPSGMPVS